MKLGQRQNNLKVKIIIICSCNNCVKIFKCSSIYGYKMEQFKTFDK